MNPAPTPTPAALLADITERVETLRFAMTAWATREETAARPDVRHVANHAVLAIDGMLRALHTLRQALMEEMRAFDDATAQRADQLIAERRQDGETR